MNALLAAFPGLVDGLLLVIRATVLFLVTAGVLWALRKSSAALRHLVISAALASGLMLPALTLVVPTWRVIPIPFLAPVLEEAPAPGFAATPEGAVPREEPSATSEGSAAPGQEDPIAESGTQQGEIDATPPRARWSRVLAGLWITGSLGLLLLLGLRILAMRRVASRSDGEADTAWTALLNELRSLQGISRPIELRCCRTRTMPLVWGFRHPLILLPQTSASWTPGRRRAVLAHELAHVARHDVVSLMLSHVLCALYWFNPLVWWLARRAAIERERACDDAVLDLGVQPAQYAEHVLEVAVAHGMAPRLAPVMAARSQLEGRIEAILNPQLNRGAVRGSALTAVALLFFVTLVSLSSIAMVRASVCSPPAANAQAAGSEQRVSTLMEDR